MSNEVSVFWQGILGIPGKGAAHIEQYNPNRTIGEVIQTMKNNGIKDGNKRIEMLKFKHGNAGKWDVSDMWWKHSTKLSEYKAHYGGARVELIFCFVLTC